MSKFTHFLPRSNIKGSSCLYLSLAINVDGAHANNNKKKGLAGFWINNKHLFGDAIMCYPMGTKYVIFELIKYESLKGISQAQDVFLSVKEFNY